MVGGMDWIDINRERTSVSVFRRIVRVEVRLSLTATDPRSPHRGCREYTTKSFILALVCASKPQAGAFEGMSAGTYLRFIAV